MKELRNCPECGYRNGFHISFIHEEGRMGIGVICPSCGRKFDLDRVRDALKDLLGEGEEKI
jgi:DNA-directed RNA polymerase subunit RPC12/RpoP